MENDYAQFLSGSSRFILCMGNRSRPLSREERDDVVIASARTLVRSSLRVQRSKELCHVV